MFDLFRSRAKAVRYLLGALLMLVAISMVVTLIPGFGGGGGGANDQVVAEIGDDAVTVREVNQQVQNAIRNKTIPRELIQIYVPQMIDEMITQRALVYKAQQLGFRVTEEDIAKTIRTVFPQLFQGGQFAGKEVYAAVLSEQNLTIPEFEANVRKQMMLVRLQNLVAEGVVVTPADVEREFRRRNEKAKIEYIALSADKLRSEVNVTPEQIQQFFQANRGQFQIPEKRNVQVLVVDEAKVAAGITVPDEQLRRAYDTNKDSFRVPERVQARHILLKTTDIPPAEVPKVQARADELLKQLKAGMDFAELAKKNSQDPGSAEKGGDLGWIVRGQTVPAFEQAAFSLKPKELSGVIKTEYGFHIVQVMAKEEAHLKPFEEVKDQIAQELKKQQVIDTMQKLADEARAELAKNPQQAEQIAAKLGIDLVRAQNVAAGNPLPDIGVSADLEEAYTGLPKGGVSPVVQIAPTKLAVATVTDVIPARPAELAEVEGQIRSQLTETAVNTLLDQKARQAADQARASGDLSATAKSLGVEVKTPPEFARNGAAEGIGSAAALAEAFERPVGSVLGPLPIAGQRFIIKVIGKTPADMSQLAASSEEIRQSIKGEKAQERYRLFEDSVRNALMKDGEVKIHKDVVDRLAASYRS
ncbi:MAG TPA: peptidyl-prolyl cis-trans isomerase [Bryobacteraceae bacterium]|nr:peptidyl-prolyl cis-trans isomerase [Bryobacteraceae bacterium]